MRTKRPWLWKCWSNVIGRFCLVQPVPNTKCIYIYHHYSVLLTPHWKCYWQILAGAAIRQYPASPPRGKVAFALRQNLDQEGEGGKEMQQAEARSMSGVAGRVGENSSISSSSASSTFSPGEEDLPPFLTGQRCHLQATTQNGQKCETGTKYSDTEQIGEDKLQSSDANFSSSEIETGGRQPSIENSSCCSDSDLQSRRLYPKYQFYQSDANETQLNVADSDSTLSGNNKSNGRLQMSPTLFGGIVQSGSNQGSTESRSESASTRINSSVISSRLFNPETLDSSVTTS